MRYGQDVVHYFLGIVIDNPTIAPGGCGAERLLEMETEKFN